MSIKDKDLTGLTKKEIREKLTLKYGSKLAALIIKWCKLNKFELAYGLKNGGLKDRLIIYDTKNREIGVVIYYNGKDTLTCMYLMFYEIEYFNSVTSMATKDNFDELLDNFTDFLYESAADEAEICFEANIKNVYRAETLEEALFCAIDYGFYNTEDEDDKKESKTFKVGLDFFE